MKHLFFTFLITVSLNGFAQDDWKLPMHNNVIQFEYNSNFLGTTEKLCTYYTSPMFQVEVMTSLRKELDDKGVKWFSNTQYSIIPTLLNANMDMNNPAALMEKMTNRCKSESDTLFGNLSISIAKSSMKFNGGIKASGGTLKCDYRIVLEGKDKFQIKYRGFILTTTKYEALKGRLNQEEHELESLYSSSPSKSEKGFYMDIKAMISLYNETLEKLLKRKSKSTSGWD